MSRSRTSPDDDSEEPFLGGHSEKLASCFRSGRLMMAAREFQVGMPDYPPVYWVGGGGNRNTIRITAMV
jgi:hypothetical protein